LKTLDNSKKLKMRVVNAFLYTFSMHRCCRLDFLASKCPEPEVSSMPSQPGCYRLSAS
jgi:hypothetical protein